MKPRLRKKISLLPLIGMMTSMSIYAAPLHPTTPILPIKAMTINNIESVYQRQQYAEVLILTQQYLSYYPKDPDAYLFQGYAHYQLKQYEQAEHDFKQVLALDNHYPDAWVALANLYRAQNNTTLAMQTIQLGLIQLPKNTSLLEAQTTIQNSLKQQTQVDLAAVTVPKLTLALPTTLISPSASTIPSSAGIIKLYQQRQLNEAKRQALVYLKTYPQDGDIHYILGLIYQQQGAFTLAQTQFTTVLAAYPNYPGVRIALIQVLIEQKNYDQALATVEQGLAAPGEHPELQYHKATILYAQQNYQGAIKTLQAIPHYQQDTNANALYDAINQQTNYRYISYAKVGLNSSVIPVRNPDQTWSVSSVYAEYDTPEGLMGVQVNYQTRPKDLQSPQYMIYAQPWLTKTNYLSLNYAFANKPELFPNQLAYAEDYQLLPDNFGISLGDTYRKMPQTYLNAYTGSINKYWGNYYMELRPTYFIPKQGRRSLLWSTNIRKYFNDVSYIGIILASGTSPDLADLNTVNFLQTHIKTYMLTGQMKVNEQVAMQYGAGQQLQDFGHHNLRHYTYLNLGFSFRDV